MQRLGETRIQASLTGLSGVGAATRGNSISSESHGVVRSRCSDSGKLDSSESRVVVRSRCSDSGKLDFKRVSRGCPESVQRLGETRFQASLTGLSGVGAATRGNSISNQSHTFCRSRRTDSENLDVKPASRSCPHLVQRLSSSIKE